MAAVNNVLEWITKMFYLNLLWILFTMLGLGVLGLFPSIAATFSVTNKWVGKKTDVPIYKTFWLAYKKDFIRSNVVGYLLLLIGAILYIDILVLNASSNNILNLLSIPLVVISFIYLLTLFYVFPTLVHYEMKLLQVIKNAFLIMIINPFPTIIMLVGTVGIGYILFQFQALLPIFSVSIVAMVIMMPAHRAFEKIHAKKEGLAQNNC